MFFLRLGISVHSLRWKIWHKPYQQAIRKFIKTSGGLEWAYRCVSATSSKRTLFFLLTLVIMTYQWFVSFLKVLFKHLIRRSLLVQTLIQLILNFYGKKYSCAVGQCQDSYIFPGENQKWLPLFRYRESTDLNKSCVASQLMIGNKACWDGRMWVSLS